MVKTLTALVIALICLSTSLSADPSVRDAASKDPMTRAMSSSGSLPGIVEPVREAVMVISTTGMLTSLDAKESDTVESGQLLGVIDNRVATASVRIAEFAARSRADIDVANVELKIATSALGRLRGVTDRRAIAAVEVDRAQADFERATAGVQQAREQNGRAQFELALQQAQLEALNLRAPFAGRILSVDVQKGQTLQVGSPVLRIADLSKLKVQLFIDSAFYGQLKVGESYTLQAFRPIQKTLTAKLTSFEPVINAATNTFRCSFEIPNPNERLPSGFKVTFVGHQTTSQISDNRK